MPIVTWILGLTSNQTQNRKFHLKSIIKILISRYTNDREVIIKILRIGNLQEYLKIPLDNHHKFFWYSQTVLKITLQQAYIFSILWMSKTKVILLSASRSRSKIYFICHLFWIFQYFCKQTLTQTCLRDFENRVSELKYAPLSYCPCTLGSPQDHLCTNSKIFNLFQIEIVISKR